MSNCSMRDSLKEMLAAMISFSTSELRGGVNSYKLEFMNVETKTCQNCKNSFVIEPDDFSFYEKVKAPPPTFCSLCRFQRRLTFRTSRRLYKRKVEFSEKETFSPLPPEIPFRVFHEDYWWSDKWDPMEYGRPYDFNRPFFQQLRELQLKVPIPHRRVLNGINSEYCENNFSIKNCYLVFNGGYTENSLYSESINGCKECVDGLKIEQCELCYELFNCQRCSRTVFSAHCTDCLDVAFSIDLVGCQNCFGCVNLRNKRYYIFNQPYSKEEYLKIVSGYDLGSYQVVSELRQKVSEIASKFPVKFLRGQRNINVSGDYLDRCKNVLDSFYCCDLQECAHCQLILSAKSADCMDISVAGGELCYELQEAGGYEVKFSWICISGYALKMSGFSNLQYCMYCFGGCSNLFGCIGLRDKQYCIFNRQYSKEEYQNLLPKIIEHMDAMPYVDKVGRRYKYGEFFPSEFSPSPYNETWAQDYFPVTKNEASKRGFWWREAENTPYAINIKTENIPDHIKEVSDLVINEIFECAHKGKCNDQCTTAFRVISQELQFYRRMNLPLPRLCFNCRHSERSKQRNPLKLWNRKCACSGVKSENKAYQNDAKHFHADMHCPNEFETSHSPDRPEIVYCEQCYQAEVA